MHKLEIVFPTIVESFCSGPAFYGLRGHCEWLQREVEELLRCYDRREPLKSMLLNTLTPTAAAPCAATPHSLGLPLAFRTRTQTNMTFSRAFAGTRLFINFNKQLFRSSKLESTNSICSLRSSLKCLENRLCVIVCFWCYGTWQHTKAQSLEMKSVLITVLHPDATTGWSGEVAPSTIRSFIWKLLIYWRISRETGYSVGTQRQLRRQGYAQPCRFLASLRTERRNHINSCMYVHGRSLRWKF